MSTYEYTETISDNYLKIYVDQQNIMWIHDYYVDPYKAKLFVVLLKNTCNEIVEKYGCTKHFQYVTMIEWEKLKLDSGWNLEYEDADTQINIISCDILDAPELICNAFLSH